MIGVAAMDYRRFILLSHLRSGTHFLRTSLESHQRIVCQTELFNANSRTLPYPLTTPTEEILKRWGFPQRPAAVQASGFVIHSYHPGSLAAFPWLRPNPRWQDVWERLAAMPDLHVVRLERLNLLRRHLSQVVADRSRQWHNWDASRVGGVSHLAPPPAAQIDAPRRDPAPVRLDLEAMVADFEEVEALRRRARERLGHLPTVDVTYEDLCADFTSVCDRIQHFLGVEPRRLETAVSKLETRPLADAVENLDDVHQRLAGTRWADFVDA